MIESRSFPQTGQPFKAGSNRARARTRRDRIGALYVCLFRTTIQRGRCGALSHVCADEQDSSRLGLGK